MKRGLIWMVLAAQSTLLAAQSMSPGLPAAAAAANAEATPPLAGRDYLYEVTQHLYRWYLDEVDIEKGAGEDAVVFWVRRLDVDRDEGDHSEWAEICLPRIGVAVTLKKTDYVIEELGISVQSGGFRIVNVARRAFPPEPPRGTTVVESRRQDVRDHLLQMRTQATFPDAALSKRLGKALREHLQLAMERRPGEEHIVHVAPLSPVANEVWVFVEDQKLLVHYASDLDLSNDTLWGHAALAVRTYDIPNATVVSLDEVPGSNEFLTRDQVGRVLYNCIVLGQRLVLSAAPE